VIEGLAGRQLVRVGQLVRGKAETPRNHQPLGVEHANLLPRRVGRYALLTHRGDDQVGKADGGGAGAEKEDSLLLELAPGNLERVDPPRQGDAGRALNIVVVAAHLVAVAGEQSDCIGPGPVLEVDTAVRENLLNRLHELIHEGVKLFSRGPVLPQAEIERIAEIGFVIRPGVKIHRQ
jgi:hypothetical protein